MIIDRMKETKPGETICLSYEECEEVLRIIDSVERIIPAKIMAYARIESTTPDINAKAEMRYHLCNEFDRLLRNENIVKYTKEPWQPDPRMIYWRAEVTVLPTKEGVINC